MNVKRNLPSHNFGYWFVPPESSHAPGGSSLIIIINESPTEDHFDPKKIHISVKSEEDSIGFQTIRHPWMFDRTYQVLAGSIEITDRYGKEEEAFSFGGSLKIVSQDKSTICTLESPAPILEISSSDSILMMFIEEIEILFAKRRAVLLSKPHKYEKRLMNADPVKLYLACLNALTYKFEHLHSEEGLRIDEFLNFLHDERKRFKDEGLTPLLVPVLEEIL